MSLNAPDDDEWGMTPYSRKQWSEIRKGGLVPYLFTSGLTWWSAIILSVGPVVALMVAHESRRDLGHVIWLLIGIAAGFIVAALNWRHCEAMWIRGHSSPPDQTTPS